MERHEMIEAVDAAQARLGLATIRLRETRNALGSGNDTAAFKFLSEAMDTLDPDEIDWKRTWYGLNDVYDELDQNQQDPRVVCMGDLLDGPNHTEEVPE